MTPPAAPRRPLGHIERIADSTEEWRDTGPVPLIYAAAGVVLALGLTHLIVGWYLANGLHRQALAVGDRPKELGVRVREVSPDRVVLEAPGPRQDIGHPGVIGLAWDGGYGRVGDVRDVQGTRFIRDYEPVVGMPAVCLGDLEECLPVEMDSFAFPEDPGDVGLPFENVEYDSPLGPMGAWLVPVSRPGRWAVHCHGWTAERREMIRILPAFHSARFTSLVIDYRNDAGAPRDPTGRHRFGLSEWEDLEAAIGYVLDEGAEEIVLTGYSTGAALVMALLERSPVAGAVRAVVADAPNIILADAIRQGYRDVRATPLMVELGMWIADLRWKIGWEETNYVDRAAETLQVPALVFHGTADQTVPISVSRRLEARLPHLVELVETQAAGHVMSWNANPARYEGYVTRFLEMI